MKKIYGVIGMPADKSITQRAIIIAAMAEGETSIENFPRSENCILTAKAMRQYVDGAMDKPFYCGGSAFLARALCGVLVGQDKDCDITGSKELSKRPMKRVIEPIEMMDAGIISDDWHLPLKVLGGIRLHGITYDMPLASAEVKSAILFAGLFANGPTVVVEKQKTRNHTENLLKAFGANIKVEDKACGHKITLTPGNALKGIKLHIPGDFSSGAFFITLATIVEGSSLRINDLGLNETRTRLIDIIERMGGEIEKINLRVAGFSPQEEEFEELVGDINVNGRKLTATTVSGEDIPGAIDELPLVALLGAFAEGETVLKDASELRYKECDRIKAICENLSAMGVDITETDDGFIVRGGNADDYHDAKINSYGDHRIAMTMAIMKSLIGGEIEEEECVKASYPEFYDTLRALV